MPTISAQTDLDASEDTIGEHVAEAIQYRTLDRAMLRMDTILAVIGTRRIRC